MRPRRGPVGGKGSEVWSSDFCKNTRLEFFLTFRGESALKSRNRVSLKKDEVKLTPSL
jgi:hypothetical protein